MIWPANDVIGFAIDLDKNGLFYGLGTNFGKTVYKNPAINNKRVKIKTSGMYSSYKSFSFIGRKKTEVFEKIIYKLPAFISFALLKYAFKPTHYTLRHGHDSSDYHLKYWRFEASVDGSDNSWIVLKQHLNENWVNKEYQAKTWKHMALM